MKILNKNKIKNLKNQLKIYVWVVLDSPFCSIDLYIFFMDILYEALKSGSAMSFYWNIFIVCMLELRLREINTLFKAS